MPSYSIDARLRSDRGGIRPAKMIDVDHPPAGRRRRTSSLWYVPYSLPPRSGRESARHPCTQCTYRLAGDPSTSLA